MFIHLHIFFESIQTQRSKKYEGIYTEKSCWRILYE